MKKSKKRVFVTPAAVKKLTGLQGTSFPQDGILDHIFNNGPDKEDEARPVFVKGCVTMLHYAASSTDIVAVLVREPGGDTRMLSTDSLEGPGDLLANNLGDYRELLEKAADFGHGVFIETSQNEIQQITLIRCACPCKKRFVTDFFPEPDGLADPVDS